MRLRLRRASACSYRSIFVSAREIGCVDGPVLRTAGVGGLEDSLARAFHQSRRCNGVEIRPVAFAPFAMQTMTARHRWLCQSAHAPAWCIGVPPCPDIILLLSLGPVDIQYFTVGG